MNKLGFGFLRLPKIGDEFDWDTLCRMTDLFMANGHWTNIYFFKGGFAVEVRF